MNSAAVEVSPEVEVDKELPMVEAQVEESLPIEPKKIAEPEPTEKNPKEEDPVSTANKSGEKEKPEEKYGDKTTKVPAKRGRKPKGKATGEEPQKVVAKASGRPKKAKIPVETPLREGQRERKQIDRFVPATVPISHEKESKIPDGRGTPLGEIAYIEAMVIKKRAEELKLVHRVLFSRSGTGHEIKRNIRQFKGFEFNHDAPDYAKKVKVLEGWTKADLSQVCDVLGLGKSKSKEELAVEIVEFLLEPSDVGAKIPGNKRKRRSSSTGAAKRGSKPKSSKADSTSGEEKSSEEEGSGEESASEEVAKPPKTKKARVEEPTVKKGLGRPKKAPAAKIPTESQLLKDVKKLLAKADLEKVTMNVVFDQVSAKYPGLDLSGKKNFIKQTVKEIIGNAE